MAAGAEDFTLHGPPVLGEGSYHTDYIVRPDIRQRLSPPQQLFRMPDDLLETIRGRLNTALNGLAAGEGVDPGSQIQAEQTFDTMFGSTYYEQIWRNNKYVVYFIYHEERHQLNIVRFNSTEADLPVFQNAVNAILNAIRQSIPAAGGRKRRKTRKQRRRMSRRRVR